MNDDKNKIAKVLDKDIREPLFCFLEEKYGKIRVLEEKRTGRARADVVMVTDSIIYGIEIKSDADTYTRLKRQVENYNLYYDRNYVVVGTSHAMHIEEHVPEWWGIITVENVDNELDFYILREPEENPLIDVHKKLTILWRPEIAHIQQLHRLYAYKNKSKEFVRDYIIESIPSEILAKEVTDELFERDYNKIFEQINEYRKNNGLKPRRRLRRKKKKYKG